MNYSSPMSVSPIACRVHRGFILQEENRLQLRKQTRLKGEINR
jgi:hypothetical protein